MLTLTHPRRTPAHRLPAGVKLIALAAASVAIFRLPPLGLGLAALGLLGLYAALGRDLLRAGLRGLWPLWPFVVILGLWYGLTGAPDEGIRLISRMMLAVAAANLVTLTTPLAEMIAVIERALSPLRVFGVNPNAVALAMALVIRFAPVLLEKQRALALAWRARSAKRPGWRLSLPLTLAALDEADHVAEALKARGGVQPARRD
ncbi:energy-coupling factor transporter transmembrane component T family protein [Paracoccus aminophilus]|uniref:Cobalt/nickel transport system, permease protein n=1 Tax=Paracoccus aminophilus JCM 7686 TaxID=1367847 RepID=S5XXC7_PARAH|nr:energy-coupling factor transporter transmembrane protein EcfT [Paracoccus aminophilus]AGT08085.1 cobalt/nickel transport system, permease protein [Paracoccus aminophilus JCM 7686]